jgi:ElaB/YqjD/DUF883 family membrane-anchored ribosome-binding protein
MNTLRRTSLILASCALLACTFARCNQSDRPGPGPLEKAGKKADKAVKEMNQEAQVAAEKARKALDEAGRKAGETAGEISEKAEKAGERAKERAKKVGEAVEQTATEIKKDVKEGARKISDATPTPLTRRSRG